MDAEKKKKKLDANILQKSFKVGCMGVMMLEVVIKDSWVAKFSHGIARKMEYFMTFRLLTSNESYSLYCIMCKIV